ncbi:transposase [Bremerella cremea]|uniref:REP-associated tyrosine transposase n=1 Tax=Bremerella cremea TaxID=1031537 RepID=UPI00358DB4D5
MANYLRSRHGATYFFTLVTANRRPILTTRLGRRCLREAFSVARHSRPFEVLAIVLLPDHLHTIWELPLGDADYSTRWRHIKSEFTRRWISGGGREAETSNSRQIRGERAVWQRRFYEHTCRSSEDVKRLADYIHVNPLIRSSMGWSLKFAIGRGLPSIDLFDLGNIRPTGEALSLRS